MCCTCRGGRRTSSTTTAQDRLHTADGVLVPCAAEQIGPGAAAIVVKFSQVNALHRFRSIQGIVRLRDYNDARPNAVCAPALEVGNPSYRIVRASSAGDTEYGGLPAPTVRAGARFSARTRRVRHRTRRLET